MPPSPIQDQEEEDSVAALEGLEQVLRSVGPTLRALDLGSLQLRAEGIEALSRCLGDLPCLESLRVCATACSSFDYIASFAAVAVLK